MNALRSFRLCWCGPRVLSIGIGSLLFHSSASPVFSEQSYLPIIKSPLEESWRWQEIESLGPLGVQCIAESKNGVWLGTQNGLLFYDGYKLQAFGTEQGLCSEEVSNIICTPSEEIYAVTSKGICKFDDNRWVTICDIGYTEQRSISASVSADGSLWLANHNGLIQIKDDKGTIVGFSENGVSGVMIDRSNNLWVSPISSNVLIECPLSDSGISPSEKWHFHQLDPLMDRERVYMDEGSDGSIWAISDRKDDVLNRFNPSTRNWETTKLNPKLENAIYSDIKVVARDAIVIASTGNLHVWNGDTWTLLSQPDFPVPGEKPGIHKMKNGELWIYGRGEKLFRIRPNSNSLCAYKDLMFIGDDDETEWFIEHSGRIVSHHRNTGKWSTFSQLDGLPETPVEGFVSSDGVVWVAGSHQGVACVSRLVQGSWIRDLHPDFSFRIQHNSTFETDQHRIWFGAAGNPTYYANQFRGGILEYYWKENDYQYRIIRGGGIPYRISGFAQSGKNRYWLSGRNVLSFDGEKASVEQTDKNLVNTWTEAVVSPAENQLWVSRWGLGLLRYENGQWSVFNQSNAPFGNYVSSFLADHQMGMWAASPKGLFAWNGQTWSPPLLDGAVKIDRNAGSLKRDSTGRLWINNIYFGWITRSDEAESKNIHTDSSGFGSICYLPDRHAPDTEVLAYTETIAPGSTASFSWTGRDFNDHTQQNALQYSYRINEEPWSAFTSNTTIHLSDLTPGKGTLEVRARDADLNIDPTPAIINFHAMPPLWQTPWFIMAILLALLILATTIWTYFRIKIRHLDELEAVRTRFFERLDQQLREPLCGILTPLQELSEASLNEPQLNQVKIASYKANTALSVFDDLLDVAQSDESDPLNRSLSCGSLESYLQNVVDGCSALIEARNITLQAKLKVSPQTVWFHSEKTRRMMKQLLEFSIDRTPDNGLLKLTAHFQPQWNHGLEQILTIETSDEGPSISTEKQKLLFEPFYLQGFGHHSHNRSRKTLGLFLVKTLCEQVGGTIALKSPSDKAIRPESEEGLQIHLSIPIFKNEQDLKQSSSADIHLNEHRLNAYQRIEKEPDNRKKNRIQITIQDPNIREWLASELKTNYNVIVSADGETGLQQACKEKPEMVILDLPPPDEALHWISQFRGHHACNHLPIVFLTENRSMEHEIRAYQNGATCVLTKPLNPKLLLPQIQNQFQLRKAQLYPPCHTTGADTAGPVTAITTENERVFNRAILLMKEHLADQEFDVDRLAAMLHMSRSTFYRKFSAVTTESPANYLKTLRLQQAAHLLENTPCTVSEAMDAVGILDSSYFSKSFKSMHGCPPSRFRETIQQVRKSA